MNSNELNVNQLDAKCGWLGDDVKHFSNVIQMDLKAKQNKSNHNVCCTKYRVSITDKTKDKKKKTMSMIVYVIHIIGHNSIMIRN